MEGKADEEEKRVQLIRNFLYFKDSSIAINIDEIRGIYPESGEKAVIRFKKLSDNRAVVKASVSEIMDVIKGKSRKI